MVREPLRRVAKPKQYFGGFCNFYLEARSRCGVLFPLEPTSTCTQYLLVVHLVRDFMAQEDWGVLCACCAMCLLCNRCVFF